jgi:hypothetical protein
MEKIPHYDIKKDVECHQHEDNRQCLPRFTVYLLEKFFYPDQHVLTPAPALVAGKFEFFRPTDARALSRHDVRCIFLKDTLKNLIFRSKSRHEKNFTAGI